MVGTERDLVLARSLYLAGERSDRPVVGVVGAAHIKGIKQQWGFVGTPEAAEQVAGLMVAPRPDPAGAFASVAITGTIDECRDVDIHRTIYVAKYVSWGACPCSEVVSV